jgi:hypothetical protein
LTLERQFRKNLVQFTRQDIFLQIRKIPYCDTICSNDLNPSFLISLHDFIERGGGEGGEGEEAMKVKRHESSLCGGLLCFLFSISILSTISSSDSYYKCY